MDEGSYVELDLRQVLDHRIISVSLFVRSCISLLLPPNSPMLCAETHKTYILLNYGYRSKYDYKAKSCSSQTIAVKLPF